MRRINSAVAYARAITALAVASFTLQLYMTSGQAHASTLGQAPLCEASAALAIACSYASTARCLLVGDNEVRDRLFLFAIERGGLNTKHQHAITWKRAATKKKHRVSDIEALVALGDNHVLAIGSHSRNKRCEFKKSRNRILRGEVPHTKAASAIKKAQVFRSTERPSCVTLFEAKQRDEPHIESFCRTLDDVERDANALEAKLKRGQISKTQAQKRCNANPSFNIEGAVLSRDASGSQLWLGLRAPLVAMRGADGNSTNYAVMLLWDGLPDKPKSYEGLRASGVVYLDLGGYGIRDLTIIGAEIWGISGPAHDAREPFYLWQLKVKDLVDGALLQPTIVGELPTSAEGVADTKGILRIVIDGGLDGDPNQRPSRCETPARVYSLTR